MALFTRADYERVVAEVDGLRALAARQLIAGTLNGFQLLAHNSACDAIERKAANALAATRLILQDRDKMHKSPLFAWVIKRKTKCWLLRRGGKGSKWLPTTPAEVADLELNGVTVIEYRRFFNRDDNHTPASAENAEPSAPNAQPARKVVSLAEARELGKVPGTMVLYSDDPKAETAEVLSYA